MRTHNQLFSAGAAALTVSLALAAVNATALQSTSSAAGPGSSVTAPAHPAATRAKPNLTPAAPMSSKVPASSAEDIRDIRQPRHLPTPIPWVAAAAGVALLGAAAYGAWRWLRRSRLLSLTPQEAALRQLQDARSFMNPEHAREYCFAASEIIRQYVEAQFHLRAPRLTTEEFLREMVEVREQMLAAHRSLLGEFLEHCDLAKFAGWRYSMPALEDMHNTAVDFVQQTALDTVPAPVPEPARSAKPVSANP
jgi:hypothetical protein